MDDEQVIDLIRGCSLSCHADVLIKHLMPSARIVVHDDPACSEGSVASYFGGLPSLPRRTAWPTRISANGVDVSIWTSDEYRDLRQRLMPALHEDEPIHRCGGHPQEIQGDMRLECQLVTNGIYCGDPSGYQDPRRAVLERGAADWHLLLQVDSDEKRLGWMWGDAGRVYFWARRQDIEATEFGGAWAVLQGY
jgi:uncharacterized protein YwqG